MYCSKLRFYIYINYIIHCKIKKDNQQVPKIIRVPANKINPKGRKQKMQLAATTNTEYTDLNLVWKFSAFTEKYQIF